MDKEKSKRLAAIMHAINVNKACIETFKEQIEILENEYNAVLKEEVSNMLASKKEPKIKSAVEKAIKKVEKTVKKSPVAKKAQKAGKRALRKTSEIMEEIRTFIKSQKEPVSIATICKGIKTAYPTVKRTIDKCDDIKRLKDKKYTIE